MVRVRKTICMILFVLRVPTVRKAENMPQRRKKHAMASVVSAPDRPIVGNRRMATTANQKAPKEMKAVVPKVLPFFHSITPAIICAEPPNTIPRASIAAPREIYPALCRLSIIVVIPKPKRPRGAGFAVRSRTVISFSFVLMKFGERQAL